MSLDRKIIYGIFGLVLLWGALHILEPALAPFVTGLALAYLLDPLVRHLQKWGFGRLAASLLILFLTVVVLVAFIWVLAPVLIAQLAGLTQSLPDYAARLQAVIIEEGNKLLNAYGGGLREVLGLSGPLSADQVQKGAGAFLAQGGQWALGFLSSLVNSGPAAFNFLSFLFLTPVVALYVLIDWNTMVEILHGWLPLAQRERLLAIASEMDAAIAGFVRGQLLVCLLLGLFYAIGFSAIHLGFGLLIGVLAGVLSFVPFLGSLAALVLSAIVALVDGWPSLTPLFLALGVVGIGQTLENYVLSPKLVGESIGLHPVWLLFSLFAFAQVFGFVGLVIAVPSAAALGVIIRHLLKAYKQSAFYLGSSETPP